MGRSKEKSKVGDDFMKKKVEAASDFLFIRQRQATTHDKVRMGRKSVLRKSLSEF